MVTVTDGSGCSVIGTIEVDMFVSIEELDEALRFDLIPNPASERVTLFLGFDEVLDVDLTVFDALGRQIYQSTLEAVQNDQVALDLEDYAQGIYWIQLNAGTRQYVRKLSVVKR